MNLQEKSSGVITINWSQSHCSFACAIIRTERETLMCSSYTFTPGLYQRIAGILKYTAPSIQKAAAENKLERTLYPSGTAPVISYTDKGLSLVPKIFGYPPVYSGKGQHFLYNARSETVLAKDIFKEGIRNHRIVIPAASYFEWDRSKKKHAFETGEPLYFAGFYDMRAVPFKNNKIITTGIKAEDKTQIIEKNLPCFIILTTKAHGKYGEIHDRMPLLIRESEIMDWISGKGAGKILARGNEEFNQLIIDAQ